MPPLNVTLALIRNGNKVLLGKKKTGKICVGKLVGPGGTVEPDETLVQCLRRETFEEYHRRLEPKSIKFLGMLYCYEREVLALIGFVYSAEFAPGQLQLEETEEVIPGWYPIDQLPFNKMPSADICWVPLALEGRRFCAEIRYAKLGQGPFKFNLLSFT